MDETRFDYQLRLERENVNLRKAVAALPSPHSGWKFNPEWAALGPETNMHFMFDSSVMTEMEKVADAIRKQHAEQVNSWTRDEFVRLLGQVIASGDFKLLVAPDNRYGAVYVPWSECEHQRARVRELEQELSNANARLVDLGEDVD